MYLFEAFKKEEGYLLHFPIFLPADAWRDALTVKFGVPQY